MTGFSFSQRQGGYHMGSVSLSWHKGGLWPTRCINGCLPEKGVIAQREKKGKCRLLTGEQGFCKLHQRRVCALVWGSVSPITPHLIGPPAVELQAVEQVRGLIYMQCGTKCLLLVHCQ